MTDVRQKHYVSMFCRVETCMNLKIIDTCYPC